MSQPTILVTGASYGLGAAIAALAAANGAQVVLTARTRSSLELIARNIIQAGGKALVLEADISRPEDCKKIVDQTVQAFSRIDAVINNAGVIEPLGPISEMRQAEWTQTMAVNLLGPAIICHLTLPFLRQTQGRVINITSEAADLAIPGGSAYCTSKAALNRFSKVLAVEEPAITAILLIPGNVDTPMQAVIRARGKGKTPDAFHQYFIDLYEQGQLLPPEKPALAAVALAMRAPHAWTGETIQWDEERVQELVQDLVIRARE